MLSILDLFRVGIGPSSSHTVGPIRIAGRFLASLSDGGVLERVARIEVRLQGSLALTGAGHATPKAVMLGLLGLEPETLDPDTADKDVAALEASKFLPLPDGRSIPFDPATDIVFAYDVLPALHPNGMQLIAFDAGGAALADQTWYSTGGGFIATERQLERPVEDDIVHTGAAGQLHQMQRLGLQPGGPGKVDPLARFQLGPALARHRPPDRTPAEPVEAAGQAPDPAVLGQHDGDAPLGCNQRVGLILGETDR